MPTSIDMARMERENAERAGEAAGTDLPDGIAGAPTPGANGKAPRMAMAKRKNGTGSMATAPPPEAAGDGPGGQGQSALFSGSLPIFDLPVHPLAECFPMIEPDKLAELADSIARNGQRQPIAVAGVDGKLFLVDGRNRREACRMAGVEPHFVVLPEGTDIAEYVVDCNLDRRHLSKGGQAICYARVFPEDGGKGGRGKKLNFENSVLKRDYVVKARFVLRYAPDIADEVVAGTLSLPDAYAEATRRRDAARNFEERLEFLRDEAPDLATEVGEDRLAIEQAMEIIATRRAIAKEADCIREVAPDLADRVEDGDITPAMAWTEVNDRKERDKSIFTGICLSARTLMDHASTLTNAASRELLVEYLTERRGETSAIAGARAEDLARAIASLADAAALFNADYQARNRGG